MSDSSVLRIYITGTPGTGKTIIAKNLSYNLDLDFLEINDLIIEEGLYLGYDIDRDTLIVDDELLTQNLFKKLKANKKICISSGMVLLGLPIDYIIILHTSISILRKRLESRDYSNEKIESNLEAEIMNILFYEFSEFYPQDIMFEIQNDDRNIEDTCNEIISIIGKHHLRVSK
ncbi:MAG: adenylate kinase family protein [Candidatus Hodarchaeales archaeon]|jgi:adenylate kinase